MEICRLSDPKKRYMFLHAQFPPSLDAGGDLRLECRQREFGAFLLAAKKMAEDPEPGLPSIIKTAKPPKDYKLPNCP